MQASISGEDEEFFKDHTSKYYKSKSILERIYFYGQKNSLQTTPIPFKLDKQFLIHFGKFLLNLTLFRMGSQPTYLGREWADSAPPLSYLPLGPEGPQN